MSITTTDGVRLHVEHQRCSNDARRAGEAGLRSGTSRTGCAPSPCNALMAEFLTQVDAGTWGARDKRSLV